ncbi:unnamed protein product [Hyaloperonospora brassicae]|uniref:Myb-like domain-containing protein n=1 Tax=Hyaloperonospora brassicae TaxID=162125 RepID=A0AAV0T4K5_HYABA|nr:unnamed protein product [Hyaloperonospora brassicae]
MDESSRSECREPHKRHYSFSASDDVVLFRTVLENLDIFSFIQSQRTRAWRVITQCLCDQGISCTTESARYRIKRLVERHREEVAKGQGPQDDAASTPLEQLLAQYTQANDQFEQRGLSMPTILQDLSRNARSRHGLDENRGGSEDMTDDSTPMSNGISQDLSDLPLPPAPTLSSEQAALKSSKKPRKRRFFFENGHDVILLRLMLADEGVVTASGVKRPQWKKIEAAANSRGMPVNTHTIRTHIRLLVDAYQKEEDMGEIKPDKMSEKQKLLREYCRKLEETKQMYAGSSEDRVDQPTHGKDGDWRRESIHESRDRAKTEVPLAALETPSQAQVLTIADNTTSQDDEPTVVHALEAASNSSPDHVATSTKVAEDTMTQRPETARRRPVSESTSTAVRALSGVASASSTDASSAPVKTLARAQSTRCAEAGEVMESVSKKQKLGVDAVLDRFISMQRDYQKEQREHERTISSEQRSLQRQTIELQTRALDIQEKSMSMQERLMAMMEKVMDKLQ